MRHVRAAAAAAAILSVAIGGAVNAAAPVRLDIPSIELDDPWVCEGEPVLHLSYTTPFKLVIWTASDGTVKRDAIFAPATHVVFTDPSTGRSLSGSSPAVFRTTYAADGSIESLTVTGLNAAITIPGQGVVLLDTGSLTWAGGFMGPVLADHGPRGLYGSDAHEAFCDYFTD